MKRLTLAFVFAVLAFSAGSAPAAAAAPSFRCSADPTGENLGTHQPGSDGWTDFLSACRAFGESGGKPGLPVRVQE